MYLFRCFEHGLEYTFDSQKLSAPLTTGCHTSEGENSFPSTGSRTKVTARLPSPASAP